MKKGELNLISIAVGIIIALLLLFAFSPVLKSLFDVGTQKQPVTCGENQFPTYGKNNAFQGCKSCSESSCESYYLEQCNENPCGFNCKTEGKTCISASPP